MNKRLLYITKLSLFFLLISLFFILKEKEASASPLRTVYDILLSSSPSLIKLQANPKAVIDTPIVLQNLSEKTVNLQISLHPFAPSNAGDGSIEILSKTPDSWNDKYLLKKVQIQVDDRAIERITLGPRQQISLSLHVDLPQEAKPGDYYFSIFFVSMPNESIQPDKDNTKAFSRLSAGIATNVLLSIGKSNKAYGTIEEFSTPLFWEKGPVIFTLKVKNSGAHLFTTSGHILIKNIFDQTVGNLDLLSVNVLTASNRIIPSTNSIYDANIKPVALWEEAFLLGPYTATLSLKLSEDGPVLNRTVYFFGLPLKLGVGLIAGVFLAWIIIQRVKAQIS